MLVVVLCIGLTVGVGLVLTRRAVDKATLLDVSHQADLIADEPERELGDPAALEARICWLRTSSRQHLTPLLHFDRVCRRARRTSSRTTSPRTAP